jgi:WD40 repeat protein
VICPKTVLLRTPDSSGYGSLEMSVAFSSDGLTVAAGRLESSGAVVSLCDVASGRERGTIKGNGTIAEACAVAFSPDGRTLAVGLERVVKLYDPDTNRERSELTAGDLYGCFGLAFSSDGRRLAAATDLGHVIVWDIGTGKTLGSFKAHTRALLGVALSPDGQLVASASDGPIVCREIGFGFFPFRSRELGCGPDGGIVRLFDVATGQEKARLKHNWTANSVSFSPDGKVLASGGGGAAKLWDLDKEKVRTLLAVENELEVYCVAFSPDGRTLAIGVGRKMFNRSYGEVKLWDMSRGCVRAVLKGAMGRVSSLSFAPDGNALATGSGEVVVLWDVSETSGADVSVVREN